MYSQRLGALAPHQFQAALTRFGLGTLVIHTAGTMNANVSVKGLEHGTTQRIRAQLMPGSDGDAV